MKVWAQLFFFFKIKLNRKNILSLVAWWEFENWVYLLPWTEFGGDGVTDLLKHAGILCPGGFWGSPVNVSGVAKGWKSNSGLFSVFCQPGWSLALCWRNQIVSADRYQQNLFSLAAAGNQNVGRGLLSMMCLKSWRTILGFLVLFHVHKVWDSSAAVPDGFHVCHQVMHGAFPLKSTFW